MKEKMISCAREHGMDAIVDYTRWTHAGHLTEEAGYVAKPLVYQTPTKAAGDERPSPTTAHHELLAELKAAHKIIRNALNLMTPAQKCEWARVNERDGVAGDGVTRANEREAAITKAGAK